jgi:outer membrane protein TolC
MTLRALSLGLIAAFSFSALRATPVEERVTSTPVKLSLEQAIQYALRHNAAIKNARIDVALQKQKNREITGIALPQINARDEFQHYPNQIQSFVPAQFIGGPAGDFIAVPFTPKYGNTASLSGSQILFDGSVLVALQARNTIIALTELGVKATEQDVRYNVTRAYYGLVVARRQFATLQGSLSTFRDVLRDLSILRQQGFVEKIEVDRTQVQVNNLATDSLRTANLITLSEQMLKYNMTLAIEQPIELTDTSVTDVLAQSTGLLEGTTDYNNRIDYSLTQTQLRLNEFDVKRYRFKALPTIAAFGSAAYTFSSNRFQEIATPHNYIFYSLVGLRVDVPIFTGFTRKAQLEQAYLNVEKTRNNLQQLRLAIDLQSEAARTNLRNSLLALQSNERNIDLANSVLDLARKKYKAGVGSNLEVTQAQTELLQAQNRLFAAQLDVINATTDLQRAQGLFR